MLFRRVSIPAICDLLATLSRNVALLYLIPSVWQIFSRSIPIFTIVLYRYQKLRTYHGTGVSVKLLGIVIVGLSAILDEASGDISSSVRGAFVRMQVVAMGFLIIAQGIQMFHTVLEEVVEGLIRALTGGYMWFSG
jgi:hypothetical protein